jgi:hypothetical protein
MIVVVIYLEVQSQWILLGYLMWVLSSSNRGSDGVPHKEGSAATLIYNGDSVPWFAHRLNNIRGVVSPVELVQAAHVKILVHVRGSCGLANGLCCFLFRPGFGRHTARIEPLQRLLLVVTRALFTGVLTLFATGPPKIAHQSPTETLPALPLWTWLPGYCHVGG